MKLQFTIEGGNFSNAGHAASEIKKMLKQLGIEARCIRNIVIALYEAEVNVVAHAFEGQILVDIETDKITTENPAACAKISDLPEAFGQDACRPLKERGEQLRWIRIKRRAVSGSDFSSRNMGRFQSTANSGCL